MHAIEKILGKASGKKETKAGEIVDVEVDMVAMQDREAPTVFQHFEKMGAKKIWDINRLVIIFDHDVPPATIEKAEIQKKLRASIKRYKLENVYKTGIGICHQVMMEKGYVWPGAVVVGTDLGEVAYGALGAFGMGIKCAEMASILVSGSLKISVPKVMAFTVTGRLPRMVMPKDIALSMAGRIQEEASNMVIEFLGATIEKMSIDGRMALCNMVFPLGAKSSFIELNESTMAYVKERTEKTYVQITTDEDYNYENIFKLNADRLEPLIALPHSVANVRSVTSVEGIEIDQALLGTCAGGRLEDLRVAAKIIEGHKVNKDTRLLVTPASSEIYLNALKEGLIDTIIEADGVICPAFCGPCHGGHMGVLASGEVCITAGNRNNKGRMGHPDSYVYLASPATVAASAIEGKITDPRQFNDI